MERKLSDSCVDHHKALQCEIPNELLWRHITNKRHQNTDQFMHLSCDDIASQGKDRFPLAGGETTC